MSMAYTVAQCREVIRLEAILEGFRLAINTCKEDKVRTSLDKVMVHIQDEQDKILFKKL